MNISLTQELESYIQEKVITGFYSSASEVIRESLRLMLRQDDDLQRKKINELNHAIEVGLASLSQDKKIPATESYKRLKNKFEKLYLSKTVNE